MSGTKEPLAHRRKRVRFEADASSDPSISEESALASTSAADDSTVASDFGSDSDSELAESSEEPSSDSSSEDEDEEDAASDAELHEPKGSNGVVNLRAGQGKKPTMKLDKKELGPDIRDFLKDFLPQLKAANDELEAQRKAGTLKGREIDMTDAEEPEQYIEMVSSMWLSAEVVSDNTAGPRTRRTRRKRPECRRWLCERQRRRNGR